MPKQRLLAELVGPASDLARIVRDGPRGTRKESLWSYTRILLPALLANFREAESGTVRIFGADVSYLNARSLLHMAREIYVGNHYAFTPRDRQPRVIDAGANIGLATLYIKQHHPDAEVMAFEPEPLAFAVLEDNVERNGLRNVTTIRKALAGAAGTADLLGQPGSLVTGLVTGRGTSTQTSRVKTVPLSSYIDDHLDFLKLDVEGVELEVIDDLESSGKLRVIDRIMCEYHHHLRRGEDRLSHFLRALEEAEFGYQVHARLRAPFEDDVFQDIIISAYNKRPGAR
jgi:FkbM family methyltransferase